MSKTKNHMLENNIQPNHGTDVDDTYQPSPYSKEQEDAIYSELEEQYLMKREFERGNRVALVHNFFSK